MQNKVGSLEEPSNVGFVAASISNVTAAFGFLALPYEYKHNSLILKCVKYISNNETHNLRCVLT